MLPQTFPKTRIRLVTWLTAVLAMSLVAPSAWAITTLKKLQITDGSQIDLLFDGKVTEGQIKTEFFNDIIQVSLNDVSVYPAKISNVSGMDLTKVFAYQYAPRLVRCRLTVKGKAEGYQSRVQVKANGKNISIKIGAASTVTDAVTQSAAQAARPPSGDEAPKITGEEKALLDRVMKAADAPAPMVALAKKDEKLKEGREKEKEIAIKESGQKRLGGAKPLPSPMKTIGMLFAVLALFGGLAIAVKKFKGKSLDQHKDIAGFLGKLGGFGSLAGLASRRKMIEVVASHHLGPKKSISVVKIGGKLLVLGVTNESINLITQINVPEGADPAALAAQASVAALGAGAVPRRAQEPALGLAAQGEMDKFDFESLVMEDIFKESQSLAMTSQAQKQQQVPRNPYAAANSSVGGASSAGPSVFGEILSNERSKPSVRAQIKSRIEGMKPL